MKVWLTRLFAPVSSASLAVFRIAFGGILLWEVVDYFRYGWIARYWIAPSFNFRYSLFEWVTPLPGDGMYTLFYALGSLSLLVMLGFLYRPAVFLLFLGTSYVFLLEESRYLNHVYLTILLSFMMTFLPANRAFSVDALLFKALRQDTVPAWTLWLLRFQIGVPYFFGGVAKLDRDWLRGEPMRAWLARRADFPLAGHLFTEEWVVFLAAYGGLIIDLFSVPLLLYSRTRPYIFTLLLAFHLLNARWFHIGIFPWLMIAATTLFFPPDWPKALWRDVRESPLRLGLPCLGVGLALAFTAIWFYEEVALPIGLIGLVAGALLVWSFRAPRAASPTDQALTPPWRRNLVLALLSLWLAVQVALPLRHFIIPGESNWTEEGHRFAWHMLLRDKQSRLVYLVTEKTSRQRNEIRPEDVLPEWQVARLEDNPHMIHQFARHIAATYKEEGYEVEVRALSEASLNGRAYQFMIDPSVDLAATEIERWHATWIAPLETPLVARPENP